MAVFHIVRRTAMTRVVGLIWILQFHILRFECYILKRHPITMDQFFRTHSSHTKIITHIHWKLNDKENTKLESWLLSKSRQHSYYTKCTLSIIIYICIYIYIQSSFQFFHSLGNLERTIAVPQLWSVMTTNKCDCSSARQSVHQPLIHKLIK